MTVRELSSLYYNAYQFANTDVYKQSAAASTTAMQQQMGVQNLGAALSLPDTVGDVSAVSNLSAYVSGLYTQNQLRAAQPASADSSQVDLGGVTNAQTYAAYGYLASKLGIAAPVQSTDPNAVVQAVTAAKTAPSNYVQSLLQSNPAALTQVYQNALSSSFPGVLFSAVA